MCCTSKGQQYPYQQLFIAFTYLKQFSQALSIAPDNVEAHNNMGLILRSRNRLDEAERHFIRALDINPAFAEAHNNLGIVRAGQGRFEEAVRHFQDAIRLKPDYKAAIDNLKKAKQRQTE